MKHTLRRLILFITIGVLPALYAHPAFSVSPTLKAGKIAGVAGSPRPSDLDSAPIAALARQVDDAETQLDAISLHARAGNLSDTELRARIGAIAPIQAKLADALDNLEPRLRVADARLAELGPAPGKDAAPEDPETTQSREEILRYRRSVDTEVKQARLLNTEAEQLNNYLLDRRRKLFSQRLWLHNRSVLDPKLWIEFSQSAPADLQKLEAAVDEERQLLIVRAGSPGAAAVWALIALLMGGLAVPGRSLLYRWGEKRMAKRGAPAPAALALVGVWWIIVAGAVPLIAGFGIKAALSSAGALTPVAGEVLSLFWMSIVYASLIESVGRALLASEVFRERAAAFPSPAVGRLAFYSWLIAVTAAAAGFAAGLNNLLGFTSPTTAATGYLMLLFQLTVIASGLGQVGRARIAQVVDASKLEGEGARLPWIIASILAWVTLACATIASIAGYLALATFLVRELVWAAAVIAGIFIIMRGVDASTAWGLSPARPLGRAIRISIGLSELGLEQFAELVSGLVRLGLALAGWVAILAPLGADAQDVFGRITSTELVLKLGQVTIAPGEIAGAVLVLGTGLAATQVLRGWLESRYLPKTRMDIGVRTSLAAAVTYVGIFVAFLLTFADLGLSLDRIALLASALTVGIGFGLQAIIGNFVSGLILLAERPVKVGDWIAIGDLEGDIRRINVRATEIEMRDRSRLIVPNSELVSKIVRNVTHGASLGRVKLVLSLDAKSDPIAVRDLLMAHLTACPDALSDPTPSVYLTDIKDGAMEITAFVYLTSPREAYRVKSDLLFKILPDLKANGMSIATSMPVVHFDVPDRPIEPK